MRAEGQLGKGCAGISDIHSLLPLRLSLINGMWSGIAELGRGWAVKSAHT